MTDEAITWYFNSDNYLHLNGLQNELTGEFPITATVTMTLKTKAGVSVTGATNLPVTYIEGTDEESIYRVILPTSVTIPVGYYTGIVTVTHGGRTRNIYNAITVRRG